MRCVCCNNSLGEKEVSFDHELKTIPCGKCLDIIYETAYPSGFDPSDDKFILVEDDEVGDIADVVSALREFGYD